VILFPKSLTTNSVRFALNSRSFYFLPLFLKIVVSQEKMPHAAPLLPTTIFPSRLCRDSSRGNIVAGRSLHAAVISSLTTHFKRKEIQMIYVIRKQSGGLYTVTGTSEVIIYIRKDLTLAEANKTSWLERSPAKRYQIVANCINGGQELTFYRQENDVIIPNGYPTIEEARNDIIKELKEVCYNNNYDTHPNPNGEFLIIDTFTGEKMDYQISNEEALFPSKEDFKKYYLWP
jgi:hypothetical protein